jgi:hypothetical protein
MTKITFRSYHAAVLTEILDVDERRLRYINPFAPLDDHGPLVGQLVEAQVGKFGVVLDPIEVHVCELHPARVDAYELKCWACDRRRGLSAPRDSAHKSRLAGTELACQKHDIA